MKNRVGIVILIVVCIGLVIGLVAIKHNADKQKEADNQTISKVSNELKEANKNLEDTKQVNTTLNEDIEKHKKSYLDLTNKLSDVSAPLAKTEETLKNS